MENSLPAQQVCAVSLVQPHMMLAGSSLYLLPQRCSLRCNFLLASGMRQLCNHCLHCQCGLSSNAFSRSSDCSFISRYKSNRKEMGICSLKNPGIEVVFSALCLFRLVCVWRLKISLSQEQSTEDGPAGLLCKTMSAVARFYLTASLTM